MFQRQSTHKIWFILLATTIVLGLYLRCSGTFRGLDVPYLYHPDEMKQVTALHNYLQGHYVWYTGSLFYDGYPYGLNHVDEWLLRPVLPIRKLVLRTLYGTNSVPTIPEMSAMYYWARGLRILYGMAILWLVFITARRLFDQPGTRWLAVMLTAIAPLSVCVSHFATGDIGVDLFGTMTILMLCVYADKEQKRYLFLAGLATGMAFGCKYNGLLLGIVIAVYATLQLLSDKRFKTFLSQCITVTAGCILGILISTPAFLINFRQTRRDMLDNFTFIKNYDVSPDFIAKPFHIKAWLGITQNTTAILQAFGWTVVILSLLGLITTTWKYHRCKTDDQTALKMTRLKIAIFSFPFIALFISLTGKFKVQPFHFSYLQIPLILCAVSFLAWLWQNERKKLSILAVICGIIAVAELGVQSLKEDFFWQREDNMIFASEIPETIFATACHPEGQKIKSTYLESGGISAFRNRENIVSGHLKHIQDNLLNLPIPAIPYPINHEWIFLNGSVFPRNDRMFVVNNNETGSKHLVMHNRPGNVDIGLRSSAWQVQITINIGNDRQELFLEPNDQKMLTFTPRKWQHCPDNDSDRESFIVPMEFETKGGNAVITIFDSEFEKKCHLIFGAAATNYMDILSPDTTPEILTDNLKQTRYLEDGQCNLHFTGTDNRSSRLPVPQADMFLPCGAYELECDINSLAATSTAVFSLTDCFGSFKQPGTEQTIMITPETKQIIYRFSKSFAPYSCQVQIQCKSGMFDMESWRLRPDIKTITDSLKTWRETNTIPAWMKRYPTRAAWEGRKSELHDVVFDRVISLKSLEYSSSVKIGKPFSVLPVISMTSLPYSSYDVASIFFHFLDRDGKQVAAFDLSLRDAVINAYAGTYATLTEKLNLPPGTYELWLGIWNGRTHNRLVVSEGKSSRVDEKKRRIYAGTLTVPPP